MSHIGLNKPLNANCTYDDLHFISKIKSADIAFRYGVHARHYFSFGAHYFLRGLNLNAIDNMNLIVARDGHSDMKHSLNQNKTFILKNKYKLAVDVKYYHFVPPRLRRHLCFYNITSDVRRPNSSAAVLIVSLHKGKMTKDETHDALNFLKKEYKVKNVYVLFTESKQQERLGKNKKFKNEFICHLRHANGWRLKGVSLEDLYRDNMNLKKCTFYYVRNIDDMVSDCFIRYALYRKGAIQAEEQKLNVKQFMNHLELMTTFKLSLFHRINIYKEAPLNGKKINT